MKQFNLSQKLQLTTQDLHKGYKDINFRIPLLYLKDCEMFREWEGEVKEEVRAIKITNQNGDYLFSIEQKDIAENTLVAKNLYDNYGLQWFETSAEKYHKLLDVNPDLKDKQKCEKLGVLYFTWEEIVEFADLFYVNPKTDYDIITNSLYYFDKGSGDWKQSNNGAKGYLLVSMEGIPYWADAVGQIPFAIGVYRNALGEVSTISFEEARQKVIDAKYNFYDGDLIKGTLRKMNFLSIPKEELEDNYDNKMVDRGLNFATQKYTRNKKIFPTHYRWEVIDLKPNPSILSADSSNRAIYEK